MRQTLEQGLVGQRPRRCDYLVQAPFEHVSGMVGNRPLPGALDHHLRPSGSEGGDVVNGAEGGGEPARSHQNAHQGPRFPREPA